MRGKSSTVGNLDRQIVIKELTRVTDSYGDTPGTYSTLDTVWAKRINPGLRGSTEGYEQGQLVATRIVNWEIRYLSTVREDMIVTYDSEDYKIVAIEELGRKWGMVLRTELKR